MIPVVIKIGRQLNELHALQLAADLAQVEPEGGTQIVLDFSETHHYEPFAMLFAGAAVRRLRQRTENAGSTLAVRLPADAEAGIASHLGFWQSIGVDVGRPVGSPAGRESNLPITSIEVGELYREAGGRDPRGAMIVEQRASDLSKILAGPSQHSGLIDALTYSLRELIRNVIEHAVTPNIWLAGMSWPKRGFIQIAVMDEGRGIRASLATHPDYRFETDVDALRESLRAGVTRNKDRKASPFEIERWADERHVLPLSMFDNTGYGLYMISTFCRAAGQFTIASGNSSLKYFPSAEIVGSTLHRGTAVMMVVEPDKLSEAFEALFSRQSGGSSATSPRMLSASKLKRLGLDTLFASDDAGDQ